MRFPRRLVLIAALAGCGASPPPKPAAPAGPASWAELAPAPAEPPPKLAALKRFQVVAAKPVPDVDTLEATLARQGLVADVGDEAEGRVVELQGVRCSVQPAARLGDDVLPSPKIEPEYARHGLTQADAEQLAASTGTIEIGCRPSNSPAAAAQVAIQVADAVAGLTAGLVREPVLARWYPPAAWTALRAERHFQIGEHVRVEATGEGPRRALRTQGLSSFGRLELALYPVPAEEVDGTAARLLVLADAVLQDEAPAPGALVSLGPAKMIYLPPATYDAHAPAGPKPPSVESTVVLADPKGRPGSQEAVDILVHRLNAQ